MSSQSPSASAPREAQAGTPVDQENTFEDDVPDDISETDSEATIEGLPASLINNLPASLNLDEPQDVIDHHSDIIDAHGQARHPWKSIRQWTINRLAEPSGPSGLVHRIIIDLNYTRRSTVELVSERNDRTGDFLRVQQILHNVETEEVKFRGLLIRRQSLARGLLDRTLNECFISLDVFGDEKSSLHEVSDAEIVRTRFLKITNKPFARGRFDESFREQTLYSSDGLNSDAVKREIFEAEILVCRWTLIQHYTGGGADGRFKAGKCILKRVTEAEADREYATRDINIYKTFRGDFHETGVQQFTLGDVFCGGGGILTGAQHASLKVNFGVEIKLPVFRFYQHNAAAETFCYHGDCIDLLAVLDKELRVSILHLSPPCQPHSPAHTVPGKDDETNEVALFVTGKYIDRFRPRIITLEQTFGIVRTKERRHWFALLVRELTSRNYSVTWDVLNFKEYGLAQARKRLILVASCPGMLPPPLPTKTHGPGLLPFVTIRHVLRPLEGITNDPDHQPDSMSVLNRPPYDMDGPLRHCLTTSCQTETNYHPSGKRHFTIRELSLLGGFFLDYKFPDGSSDKWKRHIIGNAVPPVVAKQIFETCVAFLREQDAKLKEAGIDEEPEIVELD